MINRRTFHQTTTPFTLALALGLAVALGGCATPVLSDVLNPTFVDTLLGGDNVASLPGGAPAIVVAAENVTGRTADMQISYRTGADEVVSYVVTVEPGGRTAQAIACPVTELTIGDVTDATQSGVTVRLGVGLTTDPFLLVEPLGVILTEGVNYDCGDEVRFQLASSAETITGFRVFAFITRAD